MTDKEKLEAIKAEIERVMAEEMSFFEEQCQEDYPPSPSSPVVYTRMQMLLNFIDSMQKEPASEDLVKFSDCTSIDYRNQREKCGLKDPITLDEVEEANYNGIMAGAKWQKEQMMKDAVSAYIRRNKYTKTNVLNGFDVTCELIQKFKDRENVKVIIVKEDGL